MPSLIIGNEYIATLQKKEDKKSGTYKKLLNELKREWEDK